jgi:hypothetical protein
MQKFSLKKTTKIRVVNELGRNAKRALLEKRSNEQK